jgi:hypothetical protein
MLKKHVSHFFPVVLEVSTTIMPMAGVKKKLIKNTPQKPNLEFLPIIPNRIESIR